MRFTAVCDQLPPGGTVFGMMLACRRPSRVVCSRSGVSCNWLAATRTRKQVSHEELERERRQRELLVAERLDEALVRASAAIDDVGPEMPLDDRYRLARSEWENAWVGYSSRLRQPELLRRYESVGALSMTVSLGDLTPRELPAHVVARAIANARATLAYFMRGDEQSRRRLRGARRSLGRPGPSGGSARRSPPEPSSGAREYGSTP